MQQNLSGQLLTSPDPSWKTLYKLGGISALLYVVLSLIVPAFLVLIPKYDFKLEGSALLEFIASHKTWWIFLQSLVLETSIFAIVAFVALFVALKNINKSYALIGAVITVTCQILFMAYYPILLGLVYLSDQYLEGTEAQRSLLAAAAEALIAQNNAFNPIYESLFAIGIMILSIVMLKGIFHKSVAYLGIAIAPIAIIAMSLWSVVWIGYFWWWAFFAVWFCAVGWKLYSLSRA
ncbi:MAG: hypothetical protein JSU61_02370 [Fidelibacterota bacterium]|nr:MAG: hypothetical protein JSU61_02370 [Candidatus Neomarinimicrobiota bacterium]